MSRATAALLVGCSFLAVAAPATATVVPRLAGAEAPTSSPFDFDQAVGQCEKSSATRDTTLAYAGTASLKVHTENDDPAKCKAIYARGIFEANSPYHFVEGDEFWFGAAIYLPKGFYEAHNNYTDLLRIDSYVNDKSESTPFEERAEINFASWENDDLYVRAAMGKTPIDLIGPISPSELPEGAWNWVEIKVHLSTTEGNAWTQLRINGKTAGSSILPNLFPKAAPLNRLRYGIVSTAEGGSGNLTAYFDRASISLSERGSTPAPDENRVSLWRLNEVSETTAADTMGTAPGTYINGPTQDIWGIVGSGLDNATSFDGADDHVSVVPTAPLNMKAGVSLEAWIKPDALQGSVLRRNNSYELRPQGDGSVLFRVWVGGNVQSLTSAKGTVTTNSIQYLVGTYDGKAMKLYVDGTQIASQELSGTLTHGSSTLYIGHNDGAGTYFDGIIDEPAIYSEALGSAVILERYEDGNTRTEAITQPSNPSATTNLSGWSTPEAGELFRSTTQFHSSPASFLLTIPQANEFDFPVLETVSDKVNATLSAGEPYTFRFRGRWGGKAPGLQYFSGGCIRLYLTDKSEKSYCASQKEDTEWKAFGVSFVPTAKTESYRIELIFKPDGFLGANWGSLYFDDIELIPAG